MNKKFESPEELKTFLETASPEEIKALNKQLTKQFVKKILVGAAIGGAAVLTVLAIGSAISKKDDEDPEALTDGSDDTNV